MNNNDILFAALVGTKLMSIKERLVYVENGIDKNVLPSINFLPIRSAKNNVVQSDENDLKYEVWKEPTAVNPEKQFFPLGLSYKQKDGTFSEPWYLPFEPMITIEGRNTLTRKSVSKTTEVSIPLFGANVDIAEHRLPLGYTRGTVKERLSPDDYVISVTGILFGKALIGNREDCFPVADFEKLRNILESKSEVQVFSFPLEKLGINYIAIEGFSFPFTKGENTQAYHFTAYSDTPNTLNF